MRKMKFRGKRIDNEIGEFVYGSLLKGEMADGKALAYIIPCGTKYEVMNGRLHRNTPLFEVDPETVGQFTGRSDETGREVYEGDIFSDHFSSKVRGVVKFGEYQNTFNDDGHGGHVGFYVEWENDNRLNRKDLAYWLKVSRVIGNVWDDPELLGVAE